MEFQGRPYSKREAVAAFTRVAGQHGWISREGDSSQPLRSTSSSAASGTPYLKKPIIPNSRRNKLEFLKIWDFGFFIIKINFSVI